MRLSPNRLEFGCMGMIPIGQISLDFEKGSYSPTQEVLDIHKNHKYFEVVIPDFVSYKIEDLPDKFISDACKKYNIPLIAWTVTSRDDEEFAEDFCDNYIAERMFD